jgi:tripartite-type tricarboxylate transporter receptor subunit TctC
MKPARYAVAAIAALLCAATAGAQQPYPSRPIRLIVGFAPGGNTDTVARVVGQKLGERLGTQVVIDNRGGAGGTIGTDIAARATPDGYTLTMGTTTTHAIAVAAYSKLRYDPARDFQPAALVAIAPYLLVVHSSLPPRTLKEFVSLVKSQPGKLNYGSAGTATTTHLAMVTLATPLLPHVPGGRVRPIVVSSAKRSASLPEIPTVAESGYPGFDVTLWLGFFAPRGTPPAVMKRLESELLQVAQSPDVREQMTRQGLEPHSATSSELAKLLKSEIENYRVAFKTAGIKIE